MNREEWIKDAKAGIEEAEKHIKKVAFVDSIPEDLKSNLIKSLLGGAVGSAVMGGVGASTAGEGENALLRALKYGGLGALGGTAATGAGLAAKELLMGGRRFGGETGGGRNPADALVDTATGGFLSRPLTSAGVLGGGGLGLWKSSPKLEELIVDYGGKKTIPKQDMRELARKLVEVRKTGRVPTGAALAMKSPAGVDLGYVLKPGGSRGRIKDMLTTIGAHLPGAEARALQSADKSGRFLGKGLKGLAGSGGKGWLMALPVAAALGYAGDRLWRGEND